MYKLRFLADFCLELTASLTFFRGSLAAKAMQRLQKMVSSQRTLRIDPIHPTG